MIRGFHSTDSGPFELQILLIRRARIVLIQRPLNDSGNSFH